MSESFTTSSLMKYEYDSVIEDFFIPSLKHCTALSASPLLDG